MNSQTFLALFFNAALMVGVNGFGTLTSVVYNGAVTIPLLSAAAGSFGTALAVLGVLKLGAAALLLASNGLNNGEARFARHRVQRDAETMAAVSSNPDGIFSLVSSMDLHGCGKSLVCELEAKNVEELFQDEALILTLFRDRKNKKNLNPGSPKAEYDLAAELGLATKNQVICRQRYATCPYTADEMMKALRSSHL